MRPVSANGSPGGSLGVGRQKSRRVAGEIALFVYGTLKRGFPAHHVLGSAEWIGETCTAPRYRLVDCGAYPGLVTGELAVEGEIYRISAQQLGVLDRFEGDEYQRGDVTLENGRVVQAYLYQAGGKAEQLGDAGNCWRGPRSQFRAVVADGPDLAKVTCP